MPTLKQRIIKLESDINSNKKLIHENQYKLAQQFSNPKVMGMAIVCGVVSGFLIEKLQLHKKFGHTINKVPPVLRGLINFSNIISL